jgi:ABC-2 type transport system ATP-binding protein
MGDISICGYDIREQGEQARANLGYLSQRFSLYEDLTVLENIRFFAELRGLTREKWLPRCMEILDFVGLAAFKDRRAGQLSGGMKQKLGLASALVTRPRVLLLDEPTTGVDPVTRQDFWQLVIQIAVPAKTPSLPGNTGVDSGEGGVSVLLTTPYMDEASRCHRVGFMRAGKIIAEGTPSSLRTGLEGRILEVRGPAMYRLRKVAENIPGVEDVRLFGDKMHLRLQPGQPGAVITTLEEAFLAATGYPIKTRLISPTLEDVFIDLAGG